MNKKDCIRLARFHECLERIPFPTQGVWCSTTELVQFMDDMDELHPRLKACVSAMACDKDPDQHLDELEEILLRMNGVDEDGE